jgi:hypothetical protein
MSDDEKFKHEGPYGFHGVVHRGADNYKPANPGLQVLAIVGTHVLSACNTTCQIILINLFHACRWVHSSGKVGADVFTITIHHGHS